jgi:hypothetical protein
MIVTSALEEHTATSFRVEETDKGSRFLGSGSCLIKKPNSIYGRGP